MIKKLFIWLIGLLLFSSFVYLTFEYFDWIEIKEMGNNLLAHPFWLLSMFLAYGLAFLLRAWAWRIYLQKEIPFSLLVHSLFYSLFINHISPVKIGDAIRIGLVMKAKQVKWDEAIHSVVAMRVLDLLVLGGIAGIGALLVGFQASYQLFIAMLFMLVIGLLLFNYFFRTRKIELVTKHLSIVKQSFKGFQGIYMILLIFLSWILEAVVLLGVAHSSGISLSMFQATWVNSITIVGQIFQFTPGGIGNYQSMMSFALHSIQYTWPIAYSLAVVSHGFKFLFSYVVGLYVFIAEPVGFKEIRGFYQQKKEGREELS